jgi:hypothetical protein
MDDRLVEWYRRRRCRLGRRLAMKARGRVQLLAQQKDEAARFDERKMTKIQTKRISLQQERGNFH